MKVKTYKSKKDNIHMKVTKDATGKKVIKVEHANGNQTVKQGSIKDLKLANEAQKKRSYIVDIPDNTTIETHSSPGCFTYFFQGRYYEICL